MTIGLPVSRLIRASVFLNPVAAAAANINSLLIVGDSDVIDTDTRIRSYGSIDEVAAAFGSSVDEYKAAALFFGQSPKPSQVYIGKWARTATSGRLIGKTLSAAEKALSVFTAITTGALKFSIDGGSAITISSLNFSSCANLNAVAAVISAALTAGSYAATCTWNGEAFILKSNSTGATSSIGFPTAPASGTNIMTVLGLTAALGARQVAGIAAESALAALTILDGLNTYFYGLMFPYPSMADSDHLAIAGYVEAAARDHLYGLTTSQTTAIDGASSADIGSQLKALGYKKTFCQYSSSSAYAVASMFGRILTTDFNANNTMITLAYKQEPGVTAEMLTTAQANALDAKRYNYFAKFDNSTAIIVNSTCAGDAYVDEMVGLAWFVDRIETDVYNLLYTSATKIPQTDAGNQQIATTIAAACEAAVANGLLGPGVWNNAGFGQLDQGDYLPTGFYVYTPPIASQSQADREARKSVAFQVAAKLAGAVQSVDIVINVNR